MAIATINPATGKTEKTFDPPTDSEIEHALERAETTALAVRSSKIQDRSEWLKQAAQILRDEKSSLGALITTEMGKTHKAAISEIEKCAWVCEYYADHGPDFLQDRAIKTSASKSFARYLPIGPVLAVMPWNFPFWQVFRFAAPALLAGNVGLLKHASNVPQSALAIQDIFKRAGVPEGGFQSLLISGDQVENVVKDRRVKAATLTGSEGAGRAVAETAGRNLKKTVLELGGSDPFVVMPSADISDAVAQAVKGRMLNNGQSCIAAKRFIVHEDVYDLFKNKFGIAVAEQKVGDPMDEHTDIGPLATSDIRDELTRQVKQSVEQGGALISGGAPIDGPGFYFMPGIIENPPATSPAASEELFGPVASLFKVSSLEVAIALANSSRFGLGSAIFTRYEKDMTKAFNEFDAGATFVNTITASDPRLPFGGIKASGYGRELASEGIREFINIKTCCVGASA